MKGDPEQVYLMSSNSSEEYMLDILETLALPFGTIQHFRYRLEWLDDEIKAKLPQKEERQENELRGMRVVICYLYQQKSNGQYEWKAVYPIRTGILVDGNKTGDTDEDIAHFYFQVDNYILYGNDDFTRLLQKVSGEKWGKRYAFLGQGLSNANIAKKEESKSAFHKICSSLNFNHLSSANPKEKEYYYPVFYFIDGIKDEKGEFLTPKYDSLSYQSFFKFEEGSRYTLKLSTYLLHKPPPFTIRLLSNEKLFSTPAEYELKISSPYDEQSWTLISSLLERDAWTSVSLKSELVS